MARSAAQIAAQKKAALASAAARRKRRGSSSYDKRLMKDDGGPRARTARLEKAIPPAAKSTSTERRSPTKSAAKKAPAKKASVPNKAAQTRALNKEQKRVETEKYKKDFGDLTNAQQDRERLEAAKRADVGRAIQGWGLPYEPKKKAYVLKELKRLGVSEGKDIPLGGSKETNKLTKQLFDKNFEEAKVRVAKMAEANRKKKTTLKRKK